MSAVHIFSGNSNIIFEPLKKINKNFYRCDKQFHVDSIVEMYKDEHKFGIAMLTGKEYRMYIITKSSDHIDIKLVTSDTHELQKKQKKGGSSAQRIGRIRENKQLLYVKKLCEVMVDVYMNDNHTKCITEQGIIIAGSGNIKNEVKKEKLFKQYFNNKVITTIDTPEISDGLVHNIISDDKYSEYFVPLHEKHDMIIGQITEDINIGNVDKFIFGYDNIMTELTNNMLKYIVIYENHDNKDKITHMINENDSKCMMIPSDDNLIRTFEGIIGIKYFCDA